MKKLTILSILILSIVMFSSPSYAKWTKVTQAENGTSVYVDFNRIRKHDGYVFFWKLTNYAKPLSFGALSSKVYQQTDCKLFRFKYLSDAYYNGPMGTGESNGGRLASAEPTVEPRPAHARN